MYGKLVNGVLIRAPKIITEGGLDYYNPSDTLYRACGYLPLVETPYPTDGTYYTESWEEQSGQLVRIWIESDPPTQEESEGTTVQIDPTLTMEGQAADAAAVRRAIDRLEIRGENLFYRIRSDLTVNNGTIYVPIATIGEFRTTFVELENGKTYTVRVCGRHNRFNINLCNSLEPGTTVNILMSSNKPSDESEYTFTNTDGYTYLAIVLAYGRPLTEDMFDENVHVEISDGPVSVHGIQIPDGEALHARIDKVERYTLDISAVKLQPETIAEKEKPLCLMAVKCIQSERAEPDATGYLYLEPTTQKLYYSAVVPDRPVYLCDWKPALAGGRDCQYYMATITADGDILFLLNYDREPPIVYPAGDYNNPYVVNFSTDARIPFGFLCSSSIVQFDDGSFVFGDYAKHTTDDEVNLIGRSVWRVTKPYNDAANWVQVHTFKYVYYGNPVSDEADNEIGHIHAVVYDWYSDRMYLSTGDIDRHCRIWGSSDHGLTWTEEVAGGQKWRALGMIFTEDGCYWGTDSFRGDHNLYKCTRRSDRTIDFTTLSRLVSLEPQGVRAESQATYINILLRAPNGLLLIDRAEPRSDGLLDILFYSLDDQKLYVIATLKKSPDEAFSAYLADDRMGLPNRCSTAYQPHGLDCAVIGGGNFILPNNTALFGNSTANYVGALKLRVVRA